MIKTDSGYEATATWKTSTGLGVVVTAALATEKTIDLDGANYKVSCCEKSIIAKVEGMGTLGYSLEVFKTPITHKKGIVMVGKIGDLGLTAENLAAVKSIIAEIEATPEWAAKIEKEARAAKVETEYRKNEAALRRIMNR